MSDSKARQLLAAVDAQLAADRTGWTPTERGAHLIELLALREALQAEIARRLREIERGTLTR